MVRRSLKVVAVCTLVMILFYFVIERDKYLYRPWTLPVVLEEHQHRVYGVYDVIPAFTSKDEIKSQQLNISSQYSSSHMHTCDAVVRNYNISSTKFVMALSYREQITMGTTNFLSLVAYSKNLGARTVQPFLLQSELYGLPTTVDFPNVTSTPEIKYKESTRDLGLIYNTSTLQEMFCDKYAMPPFASFEDFLTNADRELTILNIMFDNAKEGHNYSMCHGEPEIKLSSEKLLKTLNNEAKKRKIFKEFTMKRACCIHKKNNTFPSELATECGFNKDSFLAIFLNWRGYTFTKRTAWFRLRLPNVPSFERPNPDLDVYPLSNAVLSNATAFYKDMAEGKRLISVHFRTEVIGRTFRNALEGVAPCFNKVWQFLDQLKTDYPDAKFKYFVDYSPFGSHSYLVDLGKNISQKRFEQRHIKPEYYRAEDYDGVQEQGFVALVEQAAITKSDILVLVGGGNFQAQIKSRFMAAKETRIGRKLYRVDCNAKRPPQIVLDFNNNL